MLACGSACPGHARAHSLFWCCRQSSAAERSACCTEITLIASATSHQILQTCTARVWYAETSCGSSGLLHTPESAKTPSQSHLLACPDRRHISRAWQICGCNAAFSLVSLAQVHMPAACGRQEGAWQCSLPQASAGRHGCLWLWWLCSHLQPGEELIPTPGLGLPLLLRVGKHICQQVYGLAHAISPAS